MCVWVLSGTVVAPNYYVFNSVDWSSSLFRDLAESTGLIEACHGSDVLLRNGRSKVRGDESICAARVSHNEDFDSLLGDCIQSFSLSLKDLRVCFK